MNIISLFSGAGGMDLGFEKAGFKTLWANEFDKTIANSYKNHFKDVKLDTRSISCIKNEELPRGVSGVIGGPPCQSWSQAGAKRGLNDPRGKLFMEYLRVIKHTSPHFFVAENVAGLTHKRNQKAFHHILNAFTDLGYSVSWKLLNASDYEVPQDRKRVIIVGYKTELGKKFSFPTPMVQKKNLSDAIIDLNNLKESKQKKEPQNIKNHEFINSGYSPMFLSRNRVRDWDQQSFTILASERHIPFHPNAPKMVKIEKDSMKLVTGKEHLYRRLTVRECARIQTFPDNYEFIYKHIRTGYKMIGNAVPVQLAYHIAKTIMKDLSNLKIPS